MATIAIGGSDLLAISDLLQGGNDAEEDNRHDAGNNTMFTPGDFGRPRSKEVLSSKGVARAATTDALHTQAAQPTDPKAIWGEGEVGEEGDNFFDAEDPRPQPEFDIVYKQSVMAEDTFLGISGKTPGSQDCTHIVVKVIFPGCRLSDLEVDVTKTSILAASPTLRLATYLPLPVEDGKGVAKWDAASETLSVTLPIAADEF